MKVGSLCTGYGGLEMGLKKVFPHARLAWVADNDKAASTLLAARYPGVPNLGDITKVDWSTVERVHLLAAGIPCQPHSYAGKGRGKDDDRDLVEHFIDAVRVLRPRLVILENVPGFKRWGLPRVLGALAELGFHARWHSVRASEAGASHRRERVIVLAHSADDGQQWARLARFWWEGSTYSGEAVADTDDAELRGEPGQQPWGSTATGSGHKATTDPEHGPVSERSRHARGPAGQWPAERYGPGSDSEAAPDAYGGVGHGGGRRADRGAARARSF